MVEKVDRGYAPVEKQTLPGYRIGVSLSARLGLEWYFSPINPSLLF